MNYFYTKPLIELKTTIELGLMPLTIIVGLKCNNGVILASDSQQEFRRGVAVKRLNIGKIYVLGEPPRFAFAGSGTVAHIEKAVESIRIALDETKRRKGGAELSEEECISAIEKAITMTHKIYNIERASFLEDSNEKRFFRPILIGGCLDHINGKDNACLFIIHHEGIVEKVNDYATAGSGAAYAELLLKNYYTHNISVEEAIPIIVHSIKEVIDIDPNCGGETRVTLIKPKEAIRSLDIKMINEACRKTEPLLEIVEKGLIPKILRGKVDEDELRKII